MLFCKQLPNRYWKLVLIQFLCLKVSQCGGLLLTHPRCYISTALLMAYSWWRTLDGVLLMAYSWWRTLDGVLLMAYSWWRTLDGVLLMAYSWWRTLDGVLLMAYSWWRTLDGVLLMAYSWWRTLDGVLLMAYSSLAISSLKVHLNRIGGRVIDVIANICLNNEK